MADSLVYTTDPVLPEAPDAPRKDALLVAAKGATYGVLALLDLAGEDDLVAQASALHIEIIKRWQQRV